MIKRMDHPEEASQSYTRRRQAVCAIATLGLILAVISLIASVRPAGQPSLIIDLESLRPGVIQLFFDVSTGFSEERSIKVPYEAGRGSVTLQLPSDQIRALRLDLEPNSAPVRLFGATLVDLHGSREIELDAAVALNQVEITTPAEGELIVRSEPEAPDPQVWLPLASHDAAKGSWTGVVGVAARLSLLTLLAGVAIWSLSRRRRLPVGLLLLPVWLLVAAMALGSTTSRSIHPDEHSHVAAGRYYEKHTIPPAAHDPRIADTYSVYGTSYLNQLDVVYFFAGKAASFWTGLGLDSAAALRLFNVALLGVLLLSAWLVRRGPSIAAILLVTPQLWYIFSYFNADALPFFLSMIAVTLSAHERSPIARYIQGEPTTPWAVIMFVSALGLLLVSKLNYAPVAAILLLYLANRHLRLGWAPLIAGIGGIFAFIIATVAGDQLASIAARGAAWILPIAVLLSVIALALGLTAVASSPEMRERLARLAAIACLAALVAVPRLAIDRAVNGSSEEKQTSVTAAAERYAETRFKPSTIESDLQSTFPGLHLSARGVDLEQVVGEPYNWVKNSIRSFFGVYGYMNIVGPDWLYLLHASAFGLLFVILASGAIAKPKQRRALFIVISGMGMVALSSLIHSWVNDFQPQGRYLLPTLPLMGLLIGSVEGGRLVWIYRAAVLCLFLSLLSFVGVGMPNLMGKN